MNRRTLLSYILFFFILGLILFLYLLFRNIPPSFPLSPKQKKISVYNFSKQLNNANNFYKNQRYEMAIELLNEMEGNDLKAKQKYSIAMLKACCYKSLGLYNTSLEQIEEALTFYEHPFAYYLRGLIYGKQKRAVESIEMYLQCIRLDPFYYYAYERLGDLYLYRSDYRQAAQYYNCQGTIKSHLPEVLYLKKIIALYLMNENATAFQDLKKYFRSSKKKKRLALAYFLKAVIADSLGDKAMAKDSFLKLIQMSNRQQDALANYYYGLHLLKNKSYEEAASQLKPYMLKYESESRRVYFTLGQIHYLQKNYSKSHYYFSLNIESNKNRQDLYYLAISAYKIGKLKRALKYFDALLKNKSTDEYSLSAYITMAYCYTRLGYPQDSIRLFNVALEDFGKSEPLILALGEMVIANMPEQYNRIMSRYLASGQYPKLNLLLADHYIANQELQSALELILEYIQKEPSIPAKLNKICGDINLHMRDMRKARMYYQQALTVTEDEELKIRIFNNLGYYYFAQNDFKRSEQMLHSALRLRNAPAINLNLSLINAHNPVLAKPFLFAAANKIDKAQDELKTAIYFELALWYSQENPEKARKYFHEVLKLDKKHQLANYYLNET